MRRHHTLSEAAPIANSGPRASKSRRPASGRSSGSGFTEAGSDLDLHGVRIRLDDRGSGSSWLARITSGTASAIPRRSVPTQVTGRNRTILRTKSQRIPAKVHVPPAEGVESKDDLERSWAPRGQLRTKSEKSLQEGHFRARNRRNQARSKTDLMQENGTYCKSPKSRSSASGTSAHGRGATVATVRWRRVDETLVEAWRMSGSWHPGATTPSSGAVQPAPRGDSQLLVQYLTTESHDDQHRRRDRHTRPRPGRLRRRRARPARRTDCGSSRCAIGRPYSRTRPT